MDNHLRNLTGALGEVVVSPAFLLLTCLGNGMIAVCGWLFFILERGSNPGVRRLMDGLWWAFATATTTGYGDITPVTDAGKVLSVMLMLTGLAFFSMYTALFAEAILTLRRPKNGRS